MMHASTWYRPKTITCVTGRTLFYGNDNSESPSVSTSSQQINENITRHERIATAYDKRHGEIYNDIEQQRLHEAILLALAAITSGSTPVHACDLGCGAGNLTRHLLAEGCRVTAADVTPSFVSMVTQIDPERVSGLLLNGADLSNVPDATYDLVATYSVLHHIPDYLAIVREMARIVKPGGVVFIDHEWSSEYWNPSAALLEYRALTTQPRDIRWYTSRLLRPRWWHTRWKQLFDPRYQEEGDIHVWPDDHIAWDLVESTLQQAGCSIVAAQDYLLYEPHADPRIHREFSNRCATMRLCIARREEPVSTDAV